MCKITWKMTRRLCLWLVLTAGMSLQAQYFGRNKVQFEDFDFRILETEHFSVHYYPNEAKAAGDAARMFERWYHRYQKLFNVPLAGRIPVIIYANHGDFQQSNAVSGIIPQGTGGVTEGFLKRIILPLAGTYQENGHVIDSPICSSLAFGL